MADKLLLHELLKEEQEPFHLKSYIADRKSQLKKPILHLQKRIPSSSKRTSNLTRHACFLSFQNSPDVTRSPFLDFPSPAKSPNAAVFLHIPSRTAGLLVEAAMRIQKQQKPQTKTTGFGILGSLLKRFNRSKSKKRAIGNSDFNATIVEEETIRISCSCSNRRLSSGDWTENDEEDKSVDFEASTSGYASECINSDFGLSETRFCASPFIFSLHRSPSSSGRRTPDFCSPAASPSRRIKQEKENYESQNSDNVQGEEEEEKEQCSPVSVLDTRFEDDRHESEDVEEDDDYDLECSYERAKEQLLYRLRRFEKLAELNPLELERKLLEKSDEEEHEEFEDDEPLSVYERLVSDLIVEEKSETIHSTTPTDVVMGRVSKRFDSWKEVEFNTIDMMVGLDLKRGFEGWTKFDEQVAETAQEIELEIYALLIEELYDETMF